MNPARLELARKRRGLTMKDLAARCEVSTRTLSAWETGAAEPRPDARAQLAAVLELPPSFFTRDDPAELVAENVSFRALSAMTARERDQALAAGVMAFELDAWLTDRFTGPEVDVLDLPDTTPEVAAEQVRAAWSLGDAPVSKVIPLLESRGIRVYSLVNGTRRLDAYATWHDHVPFTFLNTDKSAERGRFDLCHELGHVVMHKGVQTVRDRRYEHGADRFAGAFLMPASGVYARSGRRTSLDDVMTEKRYWGVPAMAYVYRIHELRLLSDWHYRSYCIELTKLGYRADEPDGQRPESSLSLAKMFGLLRRGRVTMRQIAADLDSTEKELSQLVFGLVLASVDGEALAPRTPRAELTLHQGLGDDTPRSDAGRD